MSAQSTVARSMMSPTRIDVADNAAIEVGKKKLGFLRRAINVITTLTLCVSASTAIMRVLPLGESFPRVGIEAVLNWFLLFAVLQLGVQLLLRHRVRSLVAAAVVLVLGSYFVPGLVPKAQPQHTSTVITAFSANLFGSSTTHDGIRDELRASGADVVSLQELTPRWISSLAPVLGAYPHQVFLPRECCHGIGFASKYPIVQHEVFDIGNNIPAIRATVRIGDRLVDIWSIHTYPPNQAHYTDLWVEQTDRLIRRFRNRERTTIAMGDFNASPTSRTYHRLTELSGLDGAHERLGRGYATTWPNGTLPLPPIRLDHMLVSNDMAVRSIREGVGAGSDHQPLTAVLAF